MAVLYCIPNRDRHKNACSARCVASGLNNSFVRWVCLFFFAAGVFASDNAHAQPLRILMIGSSYTAGVKDSVQGFFDHDPQFAGSFVGASAIGGGTLEQHSRNFFTKYEVQHGNWDAVVLQDSSMVPSRASRFPDSSSARVFWLGGRAFSDAATAAVHDTRLIYFSSWSRPAGHPNLSSFGGTPQGMQWHTNNAYQQLSAEYPGSEIAYVGDAWLESLSLLPEIVLHSNDQVHATRNGNYLSAAVIFETITGKSSIGNPFPGELTGIAPENTIKLQQIATSITQVPEPSTAAIGLAVLAGLAAARRGHRPMH